MSATSSEARTASAGGGDLSGPEHAELVERAGHGAHRSGRDLGVEGGIVQLRVPEQDLDDADINTVLQKMGKAGQGSDGVAVGMPDEGAKLWRSVCGPTRLVISAACAASTNMRCRGPVLIGFMACCPGNSQPSRCITPCWRPTFHHSRSRVSKSAGSMPLRYRPPLPRSTLHNMRSLSTSVTLSAATSATRRPAP